MNSEIRKLRELTVSYARLIGAESDPGKTSEQASRERLLKEANEVIDRLGSECVQIFKMGVTREGDAAQTAWYFDLPGQLVDAALAVYLHNASRSDVEIVAVVPEEDYISSADELEAWLRREE